MGIRIYGRMTASACARGVRGLIWGRVTILFYYGEDVDITAPGQQRIQRAITA